jgi:hypothetical protein
MTLSELQRRTLKVLRLTRRQFNRAAHEDGMSDNEFLDKVIGSLEWCIKSDMKAGSVTNTPAEPLTREM